MDFSIKDIDNPQESPSRDHNLYQPLPQNQFNQKGQSPQKTSSHSVFNAKDHDTSLIKDSEDKSDISDFQLKRQRATSKATSRPRTRGNHSIRSISGFSGNVSIDPKSEAALDLEENLKIMWYDHQDDIRDILGNFQQFYLYGVKRQYDHDDKIFQLVQKAKPSRQKKEPQPSFISSADPEELDDNVPDIVCRICRGDIGPKPKICDFCALSSCSSCAAALRKFPQQIEIEGAKDEAPRGLCCKVCVRKLFFRDYLDDYLYKGNGEIQGLLQRDEPLSLKNKNLKQKLTELQGIKQTIKVSKRKINKQEENLATVRQTEDDNIETYKDALQELNDRKARKDKRIQNRQLELDKLRNEKDQLTEESNNMEFEKIDLASKVENQKNDNKYLQDLIKEAQRQLKYQKDFDDIKRDNSKLMDSDVNLGNDRESPSPHKNISPSRRTSPIPARKTQDIKRAEMGFDLEDAHTISKQTEMSNQRIDSKKEQDKKIFKDMLESIDDGQPIVQSPMDTDGSESRKKQRSSIRKQKFDETEQKGCCDPKCYIF